MDPGAWLLWSSNFCYWRRMELNSITTQYHILLKYSSFKYSSRIWKKWTGQQEVWRMVQKKTTSLLEPNKQIPWHQDTSTFLLKCLIRDLSTTIWIDSILHSSTHSNKRQWDAVQCNLTVPKRNGWPDEEVWMRSYWKSFNVPWQWHVAWKYQRDAEDGKTFKICMSSEETEPELYTTKKTIDATGTSSYAPIKCPIKAVDFN